MEISFSQQESLGQLELVGDMLLELVSLICDATGVESVGPSLQLRYRAFTQDWLRCLLQSFPIGHAPKLWEGITTEKVIHLLFDRLRLFTIHS